MKLWVVAVAAKHWLKTRTSVSNPRVVFKGYLENIEEAYTGARRWFAPSMQVRA